MRSREKLLIAGAAIAAICGCLSLSGLFTGTRPSSATGDPAALQAVVSRMERSVAPFALRPGEKLVLDLAATAWPDDPLLRVAFKAEERVTQPVAEPTPMPLVKNPEPPLRVTYSGYLASGVRKLAIIDGVMYGVGDGLKSAPYVVQSIDGREVVLRSLDGERKVTVALKE